MVIAFTGQDGTGKSTQAALLERRIRERGLRVKRFHQYEPISVMGQRLNQVGKRVANKLRGWDSGVEAERQPKPVAGRTDRAVRAVAAAVSLGVGWVRAIIQQLIHSRHDVLILDRCFSDEIIRAMAKFGRGEALGFWLLKWAVPEPTLAISLFVAPRTGWERKKTKELAFAEYLAKVEVIRRVLDRLGTAWPLTQIQIDDLEIDEVQAIVWAEVSQRVPNG